jgi:hypothetical protein
MEMIFDNDRTKLRMPFFETWRKMQTQENLEPLEQQLAAIILQHPEYHAILSNPTVNLEKDYWPELGETNPFLHMALHQAIYEQISTNRPLGITAVYKMLCKQSGNPHSTEHQMVEVLTETLWKIQQGENISEQAYLNKLKQISLLFLGHPND